MFLQYSNNNESLPSHGKLEVWGQKHYCEPQLPSHPVDDNCLFEGLDLFNNINQKVIENAHPCNHPYTGKRVPII